jgi:hypothetical protein
MSFSKRILFGNLPEDAPIRAKMARTVQADIEAFTVPAHGRPRRPKRDLAGRRWDTFWESARHAAIKELGIEHRNINEVPHFRTAEDRDRAHKAAVLKWNSRWEEYESKLSQQADSQVI